eukprot:gene9460-10450_t
MSTTVKNLLKTTQPDRVHYPATNQTHYCWQKYNELVICLQKNNNDEAACPQQKQLALSICPLEWVELWDDQRAAGNFLGVKDKDAEKVHHH